MSEMKDLILARVGEFESGTDKTRQRLLDDAVADFMGRLENVETFSKLDLNAAAAVVEDSLIEKLLETTLPDGVIDADERARQASIRLAFKNCLPRLHVATPLPTAQLVPSVVASAGLVGGALGVIILGGLSRLVLGNPTTGLVLGGPLGAWAFLRFIFQIERMNFLKPVLKPIFGLFVKQKVVTPWTDVHQGLACGVEVWLDGAVRLLSVLSSGETAQRVIESDHKAMALLGERLQLLQDCPEEDLGLAVDDLLLTAGEAGFEGISSRTPAPATGPGIWSAELSGEYETFGHIEEGDPILIERRPVTREGEVLKRGLVRKDREGR
ncbi:MAG: hypothetical protein GY835_26040 [bacterium]|nr:hypothetical protein [bacterium]